MKVSRVEFEPVAGAAEPVDLALFKAHHRVESSEETLAERYIKAARVLCEHRIDQSIVARDAIVYLDAWPAADWTLPVRPVQSVLSVQYDDADDAQQVLSGATVSAPGNDQTRLLLLPDDLPAVSGKVGCIRVRVRVGAAVVDGVPVIDENLVNWILMRAASLFENRSADAERPALPVDFVDGLTDASSIPGV